MGYIANLGMGGFLNPPNDAEHTFSYQEGPRRDPFTMMSLRSALKESWVDETIKSKIRRLLIEHAPQFTAEWEQQVYAYFKHCYSPGNGNRNFSNYVIATTGDPLMHLGYLHIKEFFPLYEPNLALIENPGKWGK